MIYDCLVVWNVWNIFPSLGNVIIPTVTHSIIFQRGRAQPPTKSAIKSAIKLAKARHFGIANSALHLNWPLSFRASGQHWSAPTSNVAATADFFSRVSWPRFKIDDVDNVTVVAVAATGSFGTQKKRSTLITQHILHQRASAAFLSFICRGSGMPSEFWSSCPDVAHRQRKRMERSCHSHSHVASIGSLVDDGWLLPLPGQQHKWVPWWNLSPKAQTCQKTIQGW